MYAKDTTPDLIPSIDYCIRKLLGIDANAPIGIEHRKRFLLLCYGFPESVILQIPEETRPSSQPMDETSIYRILGGEWGRFIPFKLTEGRDGIIVAVCAIRCGLIAKLGCHNRMSIRSNESHARMLVPSWLPPDYVLVHRDPKSSAIDVGLELRRGEYFRLQLDAHPANQSGDYIEVTLEDLLLPGTRSSKVQRQKRPAQARFSVHTNMQSLGELGKLIREYPEGEQLCQIFLSERSKETKSDRPLTDRIVKCAQAPEEDFRWLEWI